MRRRIADLTMRAAAAAAGSARGPGESPFATGVYRVAGWVVAACGGRLESRILSFVVPDGSEDEVAMRRTLDTLRMALADRRTLLRVQERRMSRDEAVQSEDVRPLVPDGASSMVFYELFVPTHD